MRQGKKSVGEFNDKRNDGEKRREIEEENGQEYLMTS